MLAQGRSRRTSAGHVHTRPAAGCCGLRCLLEPLLRLRLTRERRRGEFCIVGSKRRRLVLLGPRRSRQQHGTWIHGFLLDVYEGVPSRHSTLLARSCSASETRSLLCCGAQSHLSQETKEQDFGVGSRILCDVPACVPATFSAIEVPPKTDENCDAIEIGFARVERGFSERENMGFIKLIGHDGPIEEEGVRRLLAFIDEFVCSSRASEGFSIMYDLRDLQTPSMTLVTRVANWGKEPARKEQWDRLNMACKVVMTPGFRFTICKGVLSTFFYVCPPSCRTFLMTDPDEDEASAIVFEPPDPQPAANDLAAATVATQPTPETTANGTSESTPDAGLCVETQEPEDFKLERGGVWDLGFASLRYGFCPEVGVGFAELKVREQAVAEEGVETLFRLVDSFLDVCPPEQGFHFLLDVRDLNLPSLQLLSRLADWCSHPSRELAWKQLNQSYRIVISSGLLLPIWRGLLTLFFTISPPISRTLLLTSPQGYDDDVVAIFEPPTEPTEHVHTPSPRRRRSRSAYLESGDASWDLGRPTLEYIPGAQQLADMVSREFALIPIGVDFHMTHMTEAAGRGTPAR